MVFLSFFSKITFCWKLFPDCCDKFDYQRSIVYLSCFVKKSVLTKNYLVIAAIIVTTRGPLYACLVSLCLSFLIFHHTRPWYLSSGRDRSELISNVLVCVINVIILNRPLSSLNIAYVFHFKCILKMRHTISRRKIT